MVSSLSEGESESMNYIKKKPIPVRDVKKIAKEKNSKYYISNNNDDVVNDDHGNDSFHYESDELSQNTNIPSELNDFNNEEVSQNANIQSELDDFNNEEVVSNHLAVTDETTMLYDVYVPVSEESSSGTEEEDVVNEPKLKKNLKKYKLKYYNLSREHHALQKKYNKVQNELELLKSSKMFTEKVFLLILKLI